MQPLSVNELQALDRKVASVSHELAAIAALLRSRYGESDDLARRAVAVHDQFLAMARQLHGQAMAAAQNGGEAGRARTA